MQCFFSILPSFFSRSLTVFTLVVVAVLSLSPAVWAQGDCNVLLFIPKNETLEKKRLIFLLDAISANQPAAAHIPSSRLVELVEAVHSSLQISRIDQAVPIEPRRVVDLLKMIRKHPNADDAVLSTLITVIPMIDEELKIGFKNVPSQTRKLWALAQDVINDDRAADMTLRSYILVLLQKNYYLYPNKHIRTRLEALFQHPRVSAANLESIIRLIASSRTVEPEHRHTYLMRVIESPAAGIAVLEQIVTVLENYSLMSYAPKSMPIKPKTVVPLYLEVIRRLAYEESSTAHDPAALLLQITKYVIGRFPELSKETVLDVFEAVVRSPHSSPYLIHEISSTIETWIQIKRLEPDWRIYRLAHLMGTVLRRRMSDLKAVEPLTARIERLKVKPIVE